MDMQALMMRSSCCPLLSARSVRLTGGANRTVDELKEKTKDELLERERALNRELESKLERQAKRHLEDS